ncbi:MAG: metal ABC transporter permease [Burkholderiaceae bacterium]|nr:metal ABC transporter permease [Burkholderiaceae bacterium]MCD8517918.1 metal ABC transporter permease [Burkholderiaceae bacterium]MCD8565343.1 metal ABC transporter permease [Burkholderiaceae bacterium]
MDALWMPFVEFAFMQRALVASLALSLISGPVGVLLVMRRMSLAGDAIAHAVLPGAAVGYFIAGMSLPVLGFGAFVSALLVALLASFVASNTSQKEDASLAAFHLIALAIGVTLISVRGSSVDLMHLLFGSILAVDASALVLIAAATSVALILLAFIWRVLLASSFDPLFLMQFGQSGKWANQLFMLTVVLTFVACFQTLGTLMAVGLLMLPAIAARSWSRDIPKACVLASLFAMVSGFVGLLLSYHFSLPSGPAIVLTAGVIYLLSLLFGVNDGLLLRHMPAARHRES